MGENQSKEEIIIAQSGNSGGNTNKANQNESEGYTLPEILGIVAIVVVLLAGLIYLKNKLKKMIEKKIRKEITMSQEIV